MAEVLVIVAMLIAYPVPSVSSQSFRGNDIEIAVISEDTTIRVGKGIMFTCAAFTHLNSTPEITWTQERRGEALSQGGVCTTKRNFSMGNFTFQQSFLQIRMATLDHEGVIVCTAAIDNITNASSSVNLHLKDITEQSKLFQIQFFLSRVVECEEWSGIIAVKITNILLHIMRGRCECTLENEIISNSMISCPYESSHFLLYRAQLNGTTSTSVHDLSKHLKEWVDLPGKIKVMDQLIEAQSNCSFNISSIDDGPCPQSSYPKDKRDMKMKTEVICGIALAVPFFIGWLIAIAIIVLLRQKTKKAIEEAVSIDVQLLHYSKCSLSEYVSEEETTQ